MPIIFALLLCFGVIVIVMCFISMSDKIKEQKITINNQKIAIDSLNEQYQAEVQRKRMYIHLYDSNCKTIKEKSFKINILYKNRNNIKRLVKAYIDGNISEDNFLKKIKLLLIIKEV